MSDKEFQEQMIERLNLLNQKLEENINLTRQLADKIKS